MTKERALMILLFHLLIFLFVPTFPVESATNSVGPICIVGSGISGSSVAYFLRKNLASSSFDPSVIEIHVFERQSQVGGRMATVAFAGDIFESGASIIHPKNTYALNFTKSFGLNIKKSSNEDDSFGIWDGSKFVFRTHRSGSRYWMYQKIVSLFNSLSILYRYGFSLYRMQNFVENAVRRFLRYYTDADMRPVFGTVEQMLAWTGLHDLTNRTLKNELVDAGLSSVLISELVTAITRINYGQSVNISGFAGAVSLAGSGGKLWSVEGGNWQIVDRLIKNSNVTLHLKEDIAAVVHSNSYYDLESSTGNHYACEIAIVASPLDELQIHFSPSVLIPKRELQHTHATFVRGSLDPLYFGLHDVSDIPRLIATVEAPGLPFSSISVLKSYAKNDAVHKIFSRMAMEEALLDQIFRVRNETLRIDWAAYPRYSAPEVFAPFILDDQHLYYVNAFENVASTIETSMVSAENVARLILSRILLKNAPESQNSIAAV